jgi:hypothetical protein
MLGCSFEFFKGYLEAQFKVGMTWDNHGVNGWHIDHIYPCSAFDLSKPEEQMKCFHYSNMQPLWANENILKGDKVKVKGKVKATAIGVVNPGIAPTITPIKTPRPRAIKLSKVANNKKPSNNCCNIFYINLSNKPFGIGI